MAAVKDSITGLYITYFNRAPDKGGLDYWLAQAGTSGTTAALNSISDGFSKNSVALTNYPASMTTTAFVAKMYEYALNRTGAAVDSTGQLYWESRVAAVGKINTMVEFVNAVLDYDSTTDLSSTPAQKQSAIDAKTMLQNKVAVGQAFAATDKSNVLLDAAGNPDVTSLAYVASQNVMNGVTATSNLSTVTTNATNAANALAATTYSVFTQQSSANEGAAATFKLNTTNVANGTVVNYNLSGTGVTATDVTGGLTGSVTVQNNTANIVVNLAADVTTEGAETIVVGITGQTLSSASTATTTVNDTSLSVGGQAFTLTTSTDSPVATASDDTFNALVDAPTAANSTLTASDNVNGQGGIDTLSITTQGTGAIASATNGALISNVEKIDLRATGTGGVTFDATTVSGLTAFNNKISTDAVTVTNLPATTTLTVTGNNAATNGATTATYVAAATTGAVTIDGGTKGTGNITVNGAGITGAFTINSTGLANSVGTIAAPATATPVTINAAAGLTTTGITAAAATSITVSGAAATGVTPTTAGGSTSAVNIGTAPATVTTINAGGMTAGGLGVTLTTAVTSFIGGQGNDTVTTGQLATPASPSIINAGAGTGDRLIAGDITHVDTVNEALAFAGFEIFDTGATTATINIDRFTNSSIGSLMVGNNGNVDGLTAAQAANITVYANSSGTYGIQGATNVGQLDVLSLKVDDGLAAQNTITLGNITATGVETVNINAVDNVVVSALTGVTALTNLNVSGAGTASITTGALALNANSTINASASTGAVTISAAAGTGNGISITGTASAQINTLTGSGQNDVVTGGAGNDSITGGAGADRSTGGAGNDKFIIATLADTQGAGFAAANTTTANIDKITDFVGNGASAGDTIQLGLGAAAFGTGITFTGATVATVTAVTVATAADFTALATAMQTASAGVVSTAATAQIYDVTVTAGNLAGRYAVVSDETAAIDATAATGDTFIAITGATGALNAQDFTFA